MESFIVTWYELLKFLKKNLIKILLGTVILAGIYVALNYSFTDEEEVAIEESNIEEIESINDDTESIHFVSTAPPGSFNFYVEHLKGDAFTNNALIKQYFTSPRVLEQVTNDTGINLKEIIEKTGNLVHVDYTEEGEAQVIDVKRDGNSHLNEFIVNIGNEEDNLTLANYYFDLINDEVVPFLADKEITIFRTPIIKDIDGLSLLDDEEKVKEPLSLIRQMIIGVIFGVISSTSILLIWSYFTKKLYYSFTYSTHNNDFFYLVDNRLDYNDDLNKILDPNAISKKVIVNESDEEVNSDFDSRLNNLKTIKNYSIVKNVYDINEANEFEQLIFVVKEGVTSRTWYNKQRKISQVFNVPVFVLQINSN
ncbi:hypothetical protein AAK882_05130 [Carnobacteriaceae bacterium 52-44]